MLSQHSFPQLALSLINSLDPFHHIIEFVCDTLSSFCSSSSRMHNASASELFPVVLLLWIVFQHPVMYSQLFDYSRLHHTSLVASRTNPVTTFNINAVPFVPAYKKFLVSQPSFTPAREGPFLSQCSQYIAREGLVPSFSYCKPLPALSLIHI